MKDLPDLQYETCRQKKYASANIHWHRYFVVCWHFNQLFVVLQVMFGVYQQQNKIKTSVRNKEIVLKIMYISLRFNIYFSYKGGIAWKW